MKNNNWIMQTIQLSLVALCVNFLINFLSDEEIFVLSKEAIKSLSEFILLSGMVFYLNSKKK